MRPVGVPTVRFERDRQGIHVRAGPMAGVQLALLGGAAPGQPLSAVIPLDDSAPDRLQALARFLRAQHNHELDARMTPDQRRRAGQMLRALDGRFAGASQFEIAVELFGRHMIDGQEWSSSSYRYQTMRLIKDGSRLVDGGYRELLRSRRRG